MRRLPVYILLDTSGSMNGEPIEAVRQGLSILVENLRQDPYALETAWLSVIEFSEEARVLVPLTELGSFRPPALSVGGRTAMGEALSLVASRMDQEVIHAKPDRRGDWKPMVFLMTDGVPTDSIDGGIAALASAKPGVVVCCAAGPHAKTDVLSRISPNVVGLDAADFSYIKAFFKWVSASVAGCSRGLDQGAAGPGGLPELPPVPELLRKH